MTERDPAGADHTTASPQDLLPALPLRLNQLAAVEPQMVRWARRVGCPFAETTRSSTQSLSYHDLCDPAPLQAHHEEESDPTPAARGAGERVVVHSVGLLALLRLAGSLGRSLSLGFFNCKMGGNDVLNSCGYVGDT